MLNGPHVDSDARSDRTGADALTYVVADDAATTIYPCAIIKLVSAATVECANVHDANVPYVLWTMYKPAARICIMCRCLFATLTNIKLPERYIFI